MSGTPSTPDLGRLREAEGDDRVRVLEAFLSRGLSTYLDIPPAHRIHRTRPLYTQGIDSLSALAFQRRLEAALQVPVPSHLLLREQSLSELAATLAELIAGTPRTQPSSVAPAPAPEAPATGHRAALPSGALM
ncbi:MULTISPECIES: acyl carrier protein [unclassified Streptomyces]|uniref:acyl carrier protein n=1 Tax=unclassified Streptomyces TaxID=2593676 RepID=UPI001F0392E2|nr:MULTISPECIES: acyl carrier protein [unclassified Streptomyces]MCH0564271.1 acyl carrier protein [Streptomyces sp. MUM 2J]MCH0569442.1 acyl carrier protein [Streptomyces sp. MUM 136J]